MTERSEGTRESATSDDLGTAIAEALAEMGLSGDPAVFNTSIHDWRCEHPDRYGPCTCFADTVEHVLAAVRSRLPR